MSGRRDKVHLWIGSNFKANYLDYFRLDYSTEGDFADADYKLCGFCIDTGTLWYDEDFIGISPALKKEVELDALLKDAPVDGSLIGAVKNLCHHAGIRQANALFWYADAELTVDAPPGKTFNGLTYIGLFEGD